MTSPAEVGRLLTELSGRRERLLQLMHPDDSTPSALLLDELTELGEQLIVAEEELRVQHEELTAARQQLEQVAVERDALLDASDTPYVLTDHRGVVLHTNRATDRLIRRRAGKIAPRPIATWFEVGDRGTVRSMISAVTAGGRSEATGRAVVVRGDHSLATVHAQVSTGHEPLTGRPALHWLLIVDEPAQEAPTLSVVPEPEERPDAPAPIGHGDPPELVPEFGFELAIELTVLATELAAIENDDQVLARTMERVLQLVPGGGSAGVARLGNSQLPIAVAATDDSAADCDQVQIELRDGPLFGALKGRTPVSVKDTTTDQRWPLFCLQAAAMGIRSMVSVALGSPDDPQGVLTVYSRRPGTFGASSQLVISSLAVHAGLASARARSQRDLRTALTSRAVIGEAMGILMERHHVGERQAFELLVHASQRNNVKLREIARSVVETGSEPNPPGTG